MFQAVTNQSLYLNNCLVCEIFMKVINITEMMSIKINKNYLLLNWEDFLNEKNFLNWKDINKDIPKELEKYTGPFLHRISEEWEISHSGSCFRINYKNKKFLILTKHQMERVNEDDIAPKKIFTFAGDEIYPVLPIKNTIKSKFSQSNEKDDRDDIIIFELFDFVHKSNKERIDMNDYCLSLDEDQFYPITENDNNQKLMFAIGSPIEHTEYGTVENKDGEIVLKNVQTKYRLFSCQAAKSRQKMEPNYRMFYDLKQPESRIDLDGMSGSPIFSIYFANDKLHFYFMGMITDKSKTTPDRVAAYPAIIIKNILDDYIQK